MIHATWDIETNTLIEYTTDHTMTWDDVKKMIHDFGGTLSHENFMRYRHLYNSTIRLPEDVVVTVPQEIYDKIEKSR